MNAIYNEIQTGETKNISSGDLMEESVSIMEKTDSYYLKVDEFYYSELQKQNDNDEKAKLIANENFTDKEISRILSKYEDEINNAYGKITNLIEKANTVIIITIIADVIIIILSNIKKVSRNLQDLGIALLGSSCFVLIANNIVQTKVNIAGIKIFNDSFSEVVVTILQNIVEKINTFGMITLVVAIILIVIYIITILLQKTKEETTEK